MLVGEGRVAIVTASSGLVPSLPSGFGIMRESRRRQSPKVLGRPHRYGAQGTTAVISGAQVRAARAMVGWTAVALAKKAVVPIFTLEWIEGDGKITSSDRKALAAIQSELEAAGIEFLSGDAPGVRLYPKKQK